MPGIELGSIACKGSTLPPVLLLWTLVYFFFKVLKLYSSVLKVYPWLIFRDLEGPNRIQEMILDRLRAYIFPTALLL